MAGPTPPNGSDRLDRIERLLEMMAERMDLMIDHHDREFKALTRAQVLMQSNLEDLIRSQREHTAQQKSLDARVDKLVSAIGDLILRLPEPPASREEPKQ